MANLDYKNLAKGIEKAGKEAQKSVNATQFEYAKVSKAPVMKGGKGSTLLQFQHYRFNMADMMYNFSLKIIVIILKLQ